MGKIIKMADRKPYPTTVKEKYERTLALHDVILAWQEHKGNFSSPFAMSDLEILDEALYNFIGILEDAIKDNKDA